MEELEKTTMAPDFYDDMDAAGRVLQQVKGLRDKVTRYEKLKSAWEYLVTLVALAIEEEDESVLEEV